MKVNLVSVEDGIDNIGFRKLSSFVMNFTVIIGRAGYLLWKADIVGLWQRRMQRLSREV